MVRKGLRAGRNEVEALSLVTLERGRRDIRPTLPEFLASRTSEVSCGARVSPGLSHPRESGKVYKSSEPSSLICREGWSQG